MNDRFQEWATTGWVDGDRGGPGGVDGDGPDPCGHCGACMAETVFYGIFQSLDVVLRVLAEDVFGGVAIETVLPAGVIKDGRGDLAAVQADIAALKLTMTKLNSELAQLKVKVEPRREK